MLDQLTLTSLDEKKILRFVIGLVFSVLFLATLLAKEKWEFRAIERLSVSMNRMTFASDRRVNCGYVDPSASKLRILFFFIAVANCTLLFLPIWDTPPSHDNHSASGLLLLQELLHNLRSRQNSWALNRTFDLIKLSLQTVGTTTCT
ncbi:hypothetical protein ACJX0J_001105 (mitochondrion) [Zea mays]